MNHRTIDLRVMYCSACQVVENVEDSDPENCWRCGGARVGTNLIITLPDSWQSYSQRLKEVR